jgi:hypothetical protein
MRIGIVRESVLVLPGEKAPTPIKTAATAEIKANLGAKLGAAPVESTSGEPVFKGVGGDDTADGVRARKILWLRNTDADRLLR